MNVLTVAVVGTEEAQLTFATADALRTPGARVLLHTNQCALAHWLANNAISYQSLDALYEQTDDFDTHAHLAADAVQQALAEAPVVYAVMDVSDVSVHILAEALPTIHVVGVSSAEALRVYATGAVLDIAASDCAEAVMYAGQSTLVRELDTRALASDVKLRLMEAYPDDARVIMRRPDGTLARIPLSDLDRMKAYDHRVCCLICAETSLTRLTRYAFPDLLRIMRELCDPFTGCPWDRVQTHESIAKNMIEEAYEVVDAIQRNDIDQLYDELGDVLLQVALHSEIARRHGEFDASDCVTAVCRKMISRHEHIFGTAHAETSDDVLRIWEEVKKREKHCETQSEVLQGVTKGLPALMRAEKVQKRAADVGFDFDSAEAALQKVYEEADEVRAALACDSGWSEELGDLLFAVVNVIRLRKLDPELALGASTEKFIRRFSAMEEKILADGKRCADMTLAEMDQYWDLVKSNEKS